MQVRYQEITAESAYLDKVLTEGADKATEIAEVTIRNLKQAMGFYIWGIVSSKFLKESTILYSWISSVKCCSVFDSWISSTIYQINNSFGYLIYQMIVTITCNSVDLWKLSSKASNVQEWFATRPPSGSLYDGTNAHMYYIKNRSILWQKRFWSA